MSQPLEQTLHVHNRVHRPLKNQPVTYGVPWPEGELRDLTMLRLRDEQGEFLPAAFTELNRWPDGSLQWTLCDLSLDFAPSDTRALTITGDQSAPAAPATPEHPVTASIEDGVARVSNGLIDLAISSQPGRLVDHWRVEGRDLVEENGLDVTFDTGARATSSVAAPKGGAFSVVTGAKTIRLERSNPMRVLVRVEGKHTAEDGATCMDFFMRFEVRAGRADVAVTHSFRNREMPVPGVTIRNLQATIRTTVAPNAQRCFTASNRTRHYLNQFMRVSENPSIVASNTGDLANWPTAHTPRQHGDVFVADADVLHDPPADKPWFMRDPSFRKAAGGNKCVWPYLALLGPAGGVITAIDRMNALHPKSLDVDGATFRYGLWPDWAGDLPITQGAGRSHTLRLGPVPADANDLDIQNLYLSWELGGVHTHVAPMETLEISPDIDHVRRCGVFGVDMLPPFDPAERFRFERKVMDAWLGVSYGQLGAMDQVVPFPAAGFWDFGDNGLSNNEEMAGLVYFQNHLRSGNWACAERAINGARHMMEVDHCAFSIDPFQNGGNVAHCNNHNDGAAYPSHMWFTELLFAYALTGDEEFKACAMRTCDNLLHWIHDDEGWQIISADQREAGQPLINLTWCYGFNPDPRYLEGCSKIIREYLMANAAELGRMLDKIPMTMPVKVASYGDYAAWEGMFWYWTITSDDEVRQFMLKEFDWRVTEACSGIHGFHRSTDFNPAAYAYYLSGGDRAWLERVARPLQAAFGAARWPIGWVHAMYALKLAFEHGLISDDDVTVC